MSKRVAMYMRVSTQDQSVEIQERDLRQYVTARSYTCVREYTDKATGTNANRPALKALLADARARNIDIIVVWKLDRFFRSLKDLVNTLHELTELGVEFISLKDNIDLTTSSGRLMMAIIGAMAQFEVDLIRSRVRAGIANAKAKGIRLGRPSKVTMTEVTQMMQMQAAGYSLRAIAKHFKLAKSSVHKILKENCTEKSSINLNLLGGI